MTCRVHTAVTQVPWREDVRVSMAAMFIFSSVDFD